MQRQEGQIAPYYDNLRDFLHDLAQPLSTVTGLIDLMLLELDERDKMFQEVQLISQQLEKVMEIVGGNSPHGPGGCQPRKKSPGTAPGPAVLMAGPYLNLLFQRS